MKKIDSLTGMRFIMTMVIVLSHMEFLSETTLAEPYSYVHNALPAVDFFFMLSGFGLMYSRSAKPGMRLRPLGDAARRIRKLYPMYLLTMAVSIPYSVYTYWLSGENTRQIIQAVVRRVVLCVPLLQSCTGIQSYTNAFNGVCWFLSCLFVLYIVFPFLARLADFLCRNIGATLVCMAGTWGLFLACAKGMMWVQERYRFDNLIYGAPYGRVFYFFTGMVCWHLWDRLRQKLPWSPARATTAEIVVVAAVFLWFVSRMHLSLPWFVAYLLDLGLVAVLLVILALGQGRLSAALSSPKMQRLGNAAMYMYLLHYPVRLYTDLFIHTLWPKPDTVVLVLECAALFAVSIGAALVLYDRAQKKKAALKRP